MKTLLVSLAATLALSLVPSATPVAASTGIQRCQAADGTRVYTDKACAAFGARAVPMSGELLTRIARDEARSGATQGSTLGDAGAALPSATATAGIGRRSPAAGCARSPTQLLMDLQGSMALGDVNRIAESYDWTGITARHSITIMDRLERLADKPVVDAHYFGASIGAADGGGMLASASADSTVGGIVQLVSGAGTGAAVVDFDVTRRKDCYFVRF